MMNSEAVPYRMELLIYNFLCFICLIFEKNSTVTG